MKIDFAASRQKDLLDIASLSDASMRAILDSVAPFKELFSRSVKKVPALRGKTVLSLFYEPSTRTRTSFEIAAKRLSADVSNFAISQSSVVKGESVKDMMDTLAAMKVDYLIVRHGVAGIPHMMAKYSSASVVNAGDGYHAHPTQALLDAYTLEEQTGSCSGKRVLIIGDISHSRVARSTALCFHRLGAQVAFLGPGSLLPALCPPHVERFCRYDQALAWRPDVIYLLRLQQERQEENLLPSLREYHRFYGINQRRLDAIRERGIYVMHPGPVNRGVELGDAVMDYERSLISAQVENGIAVRMAVLYGLQPQTMARSA